MRRLLIALVGTALAVMLASPAKAITNGEPDRGRHPYVGLAVFDGPNGPTHRCSASLLSPTVVLTAGHCTDGAVAARVWFAEDVQNNNEYPFGGATSHEGVPYTYPTSASAAATGCPASPSATSASSCCASRCRPVSSAAMRSCHPAVWSTTCRGRQRSPWSATGCRSGSSVADRRCGRGSGCG